MDRCPNAIFVYGTLQRGERRERDWPRAALAIEPAIVRGELYDLDRYPALRPGAGYVAGELWTIASADLEMTLHVLDDIEQFRQREDDLYYRELVECTLNDGTKSKAYAYIFAQVDRLRNRRPLPSDHSAPARWRRRST